MWTLADTSRFVATTALSMLCGCYSYQPAGKAGLTPGALVRVQFSPPRDMVMRVSKSDSGSVHRLRRIEGRFLSFARDTLSLVPVTARTVTGRKLVLLPDSVEVASCVTDSVTVWRLDRARTTFAITAPITLIAIWLAAVVEHMRGGINRG
jgi:hypothetical protein